MFMIFPQECLFVWFIKEGFGNTEAEHILENATLTNSLAPSSWSPDGSICVHVSLFVPKSVCYPAYLDTLHLILFKNCNIPF